MEPAEIARTAADAADPLAGLRAVASLRRVADMLESQQVENALRAGRGWVEIAAALGVTRQAVHKKYAKRFPLPGRTPR
ncbi:hypothetical protein G7070_11020 [Propioniciclava coleopterorum]|uniref:Homeodomain-like domain-containing protein n=1 Tax=Propioniciclava coleopterorum TaxID=2714937 RepID=A0A6G7Y7Q1_9ACTN|nr:hypothetical protein [Propioniciclava coleopterorum]QIK72706.1 hypothetical protein G7070_11020 [Propioniciclava coleopterorum]